MKMQIRLNKYISECGIASRRKSDELISGGRVKVNGITVNELGMKIDPQNDSVSIDGESLKHKSKLYFLLNKPRGIITSTKDEKNRRTVTDLISTNERIFPVGRLDYDTSGLIILTNDGEFSNFLTHPKNGIEREYEVTIDQPLSIEDKNLLLKGIYIDKRKGLFTKITYPRKNNYTLIRAVTVEGRNHFVKRMFASLGYKVKDLKRIRFGNMTLKNLRSGEYRRLSAAEIEKIKN
jgi:pseudouridine synthase